jgi:hypothetical protein
MPKLLSIEFGPMGSMTDAIPKVFLISSNLLALRRLALTIEGSLAQSWIHWHLKPPLHAYASL